MWCINYKSYPEVCKTAVVLERKYEIGFLNAMFEQFRTDEKFNAELEIALKAGNIFDNTQPSCGKT
jgi:hypothetical protein